MCQGWEVRQGAAKRTGPVLCVGKDRCGRRGLAPGGIVGGDGTVVRWGAESRGGVVGRPR